jgi:hypothetical protein
VLSLHPSVHAGAFVLGWAGGLVAASVVVLALVGLAGIGAPSPAPWVGPLRILIGVVLLLLGIGRWSATRRSGLESGQASWLGGIEQRSIERTFAMGAVQAGVNPRNLLLVVAAILVIGEARLGAIELVVALATLVALGSLGVALPLVRGRAGLAARARLEADRARLVDDNGTIQAVSLYILAALLIGQGWAAVWPGS